MILYRIREKKTGKHFVGWRRKVKMPQEPYFLKDGIFYKSAARAKLQLMWIVSTQKPPRYKKTIEFDHSKPVLDAAAKKRLKQYEIVLTKVDVLAEHVMSGPEFMRKVK